METTRDRSIVIYKCVPVIISATKRRKEKKRKEKETEFAEAKSYT